MGQAEITARAATLPDFARPGTRCSPDQPHRPIIPVIWIPDPVICASDAGASSVTAPVRVRDWPARANSAKSSHPERSGQDQVRKVAAPHTVEQLSPGGPKNLETRSVRFKSGRGARDRRRIFGLTKGSES
jgi:hypothetical protein